MSQVNNLILSLAGHPDLRIRMIGNDDIEALRTWKNEHKNSFFLKQEITAEQQEKWYAAYSGREHDHMFVVEQLEAVEWKKIGCMGFRKIEDEGCVDAYNIIRSRKIEPASFTMSEAFNAMLAYAASLYPGLPLQVKVLSGNPAVQWYRKNRFSILKEVDNYFLMELAEDALKNINWTIKNTI